MRLSDEQRSVVDAGPIDLFISAGAGSGKTRVLTARFVAAVLGQAPYPEMSPGSILTVTFTDRAAGELAERIRGALIAQGSHERSRRVDDAWISTIHGMCSRILRQHAFEAGLDPRFSVAADVEAGTLAHEAFEDVLTRGLEADDDALYRLAETMGSTKLLEALQDAYAGVRSMGHTPADIVLMSDEEIAAELLRSAAALERLAETIQAGCNTALKTIAGNVELMREAARVTRLLSGGEPDAGSEPVAPKKPSRVKGHDEHNELVEQAKLLIERIGLLSVQREARPYEEAFLRLLGAFDRSYAELKAQRSLLDFEDLQTMVARLLERRPDIAQEYRDRFRMVMIDEFQDTNALQVKIAGHLSDGDLCTVGDEKQSIYAFRHADVEVFRARERTVAQSSKLMDNYRSHLDLLEAFNGIFGSDALFGASLMRLNPAGEQTDDDGWPSGIERARVVFVDRREGCELTSAEAEARVIAREFSRLRDEGVPQGDMTLLLRVMAGAAEVFARELRLAGFDVFIASGGTYFDTQETREVTALLRLADNVLDDEAALVVLAGRLTGVSDDALYRLREAAGRHGSLWRAARDADSLEIATADKRVIARAVGVIERMRASRGAVALRTSLIDACEQLDYDLVLFAEGPEGPRAWANVLKLARMAEEFEKSAHGDIGSFLDYLAAREQHAASESQATVAADGRQAVRVMSVHAAKGLEFPVVGVASFSADVRSPRDDVLLGSVDDVPRLGMRVPGPEWGPSANKKMQTYSRFVLAERMKKADAEESQRVLYVACTRAEKGLIVCMNGDLSKEASGSAPPAVMRRALGLEDEPSCAEFYGNGQAITLPTGGRVGVSIVEPEPGWTAQDLEVPVCGEPPMIGADSAPEVRQGVRPATISYSGLGLFDKCPRRFYAEKVLGIPPMPQERHGDAADPLAFGDAFHRAMREMWERGMPDADRLADIAIASGLGSNAVGRLEAALSAFAASPLAGQVRSAERIVAECPINAPVHGCILIGAIDLISWVGDDALIIDYKTGSAELSAEAARARYALQSECYGLAALRAGARKVTVTFFEPERQGRCTEYAYTQTDADGIEDRIGVRLDVMEAGELSALETYDPSVCEDCAVSGTLCDVTRSGAD